MTVKRRILNERIPGLLGMAHHSQRGMSIIELLAAVTIGVFVVMAAMEAYLTLQSSVVKQDQITEMQQSGRAAMRVLSERLRMAGFSLPTTLDALAGTNSDPDTVTVWHMDAVGCEVSTTANMAGPGEPLVCAGSAVDCFQVNRPAYIFNASAGTGEFFTVTGTQASPEGLTHNGLSQTYPIGSRVSFIREVHFFLDNSDTLHPLLMMQEFNETPQAYAENIEDFQVRYVMSDGDTLDTPVVPSLVSRVLIDLVSRTGRQDNQVEQDYLRRNYAFQISVRNNE